MDVTKKQKKGHLMSSASENLLNEMDIGDLVKSSSSSEPEVNPIRPRRIFTAKYKLAVLDELDRCTLPGEKGAILQCMY